MNTTKPNVKSITIIIKQPLERLPPIINLIDCLSAMEYDEINLVCTGVSSLVKSKYADVVNFTIIDIKEYKIPIIGKIYSWLTFRSKVFKLLKSDKKLLRSGFLWIGSADAALALGRKLFKYNYVFQCHELYDAFPLYHRKLKDVMRNALININPEDNRGAIFRCWYNLKDTPVTLPNKPFFHPRERNLPITDPIAREIVEKIKDKKILLYQGGIVKERDITPIAKAVEKMSDDWVLVLMGYGYEGYLEDILKKYPKVVHVPPIPAPFHLEVTSWAKIGLVPYIFADLNHVFCAPNKTWEYAGFGIPTLGNDIPGILNDVNRFGSGEALNLNAVDSQEIINVIEKMDSDYDNYSRNAISFYDSVDIVKIILSIIEKADYLNRTSIITNTQQL